MIRVTDYQQQTTILNILSQRVNDVSQSEMALSSGKKINKPSDDPAGAAKVSALNTALSKMDRYSKNMGDVSSNMKMADSVLIDAHNLLQQANQLANEQATGTATADTRATAAKEVDVILQQLVQVGNTSLGGKYLFAGYKNSTPPFDNSGNYVSDSGVVQSEIGPGNFTQSNIPGDTIFGAAGGVDIFGALKDLSAALTANDTAGIGSAMDKITASYSQVEASQAQVGAVENLVTNSQSSLQNEQVSMQTLLSDTRDIDLVQAITAFQTQSAALTAARQAASKLFDNSLLDYIK